MKKALQLCLDDMAEQSFIYTQYDIGGRGHSVTIKEEDKEKFILEYLKYVREQLESNLTEFPDCDGYEECFECGSTHIEQIGDITDNGDIPMKCNACNKTFKL